MKILQVNDDLILELWPAGQVSDGPAVSIKNLATKDDDEGYQVVVVHVHEIRDLIASLAQALVFLASPSVLEEGGQ